MGGLVRRGALPIAALVLAFALAAVGPATAAADTPPPMCEREFAVDYAAPLAAMPNQAPPPEGELPFGPHNFGIHRIEAAQVALQGSNFGYRFAAKGAGTRKIDLGWRATATLRQVTVSGEPGPVLSRRGWRVRRVKNLNSLQLSFPAERAGFFRVDLRFGRLDGHPLGSYRDYFRVLRRSVDVKVAVSAAAVHRGEPVYAQLENRGASRLSSRHSLGLERRAADGGWVEVAQAPTPETVIGTSWLLYAGELLSCQRYEVPLGTVPGRYRFAAAVNVAPEFQQRSFFGGFEILP
jgi:hypothetical protein